MISQYNGSHSITIGIDPITKLACRNTWTDWGLIPSSRPLVNMPEVNSKYLEIPGMNGKYDLTDALCNYPTYGMRTGSWEFHIAHDVLAPKYGVSEDHVWEVVYEEIAGYLHGQGLRCILDDDPWYYYDGRFSINSFKSNKAYSTITIDYTLEPYKWSILSTADINWPWDPFDFSRGVVPTVINYDEIPGTYEQTSPDNIFRGIKISDKNSFVNVRWNSSWNIPQSVIGSAPVTPIIYFDPRQNTQEAYVKYDNSVTGVFTYMVQKPNDWDTSWGQYYEKRGYHYILLKSLYETAPSFVPRRFYIRASDASAHTYTLKPGVNDIPGIEFVCPTSDDWVRIALRGIGYVTIDFRIGRL